MGHNLKKTVFSGLTLLLIVLMVVPVFAGQKRGGGAFRNVSTETLKVSGKTTGANAKFTNVSGTEFYGSGDGLSFTNISATGFYGSGAGLTGMAASQVSLGNVTNDAQLKRAANDFSSFTAKGTLVTGDILLVEDSEASGVKKYATFGAVGSLLNAGRLVGFQIFTSGTAATYTPTVGTSTIIIELVGGGGAGGGAVGAGSQASAGGGGSSGGYLLKRITGISGTGTYTVGAGGAGVEGNTGNNGGDTTFTYGATTYTAPGGVGAGYVAAGTSATIEWGTPPGSTPTNGDLNILGGPGMGEMRLSGSVAQAGGGGNSRYGSGRRAYSDTGTVVHAGEDASGYGAGGAGALVINSASNFAGGNGSRGVIIIWEFS